MGPRADLDGRKISYLPGFDPGPSSPLSVAIPTELPGPHYYYIYYYIIIIILYICIYSKYSSNRRKGHG